MYICRNYFSHRNNNHLLLEPLLIPPWYIYHPSECVRLFAGHIANRRRRVDRHSCRLADRDGPKALVRGSLERARGEDVVAAVKGRRDEDVGDNVVGSCETC